MEAHGDVVGRTLGTRMTKQGGAFASTFVKDQREGAGECHLQRVNADLAVSLTAMTVARREQRARCPHRQEERAAGDKLAIVDVAAMTARLAA